MLNQRFSKFVFVVLALALWAGTAYALPASDFSATPNPVTLTRVIGTTDPQASESTLVTLTNNNGSSAESFTVGTAGWPAWLAALPPGTSVPSTQTIADTFAANTSGNIATDARSLAAGTYTYTVLINEAGNTSLQIPVTLIVVGSPLSAVNAGLATVTSLSFTNAAGQLSAAQTIQMELVPGSIDNTAYQLDLATVPLWLNITGLTLNAGQANLVGTIATATTMTLTLDPSVPLSLSTGIYTANVGFTSLGYGEFYLPITLSVSNAPPTLALKEGPDGTVNNLSWSAAMTIPIPSVTPYSSNEPIPFTASCTIALSVTPLVSPACVTNVSSGLAYSWGTTVTVPGLTSTQFGAQLGNTVTVTITITPTSASSLATISIVNIYTLVPIPATITSISPSAVAPLASGLSTVVLVQGTGFVGPGGIAPASSLGPTKVWLGATVAGNSVVLSNTLLQVTVPANALPTITASVPTPTLAIGLANYAGTSAPTAPLVSYNLTVTNGPVIYGLTDTATYVQPAAGIAPKVAAYELISIFGANFGSAGVGETPDKYNKVPTSLTLSGSGTTAVTLKVTFTIVSGKTTTTYSAPILYANETQINAIVPSGMTVGATANVTVTSGTLTTNPFAVTVVTADPGIFTMASDGTGPGAILNVKANGASAVNGAGPVLTTGQAPAVASDTLSIYVTGLGAPDSTGLDALSNKSSLFPSACVAINGTKALPGYLQVVNTSTTNPVYTSPAWTTIDGAVISFGANTILGGLPPCMLSAVSVVIGTAPNTMTISGNSIGYAGFVSGAVAGLYQVNATLPAAIPGWAVGTAQPIQVIIGGFASPANSATVQF